MNKPKSIKVIAILILIFSGLSLLITTYNVIQVNFFPNGYYPLGHSTNYALINSIITVILDILFIIGAIELLKYKKWGRKIVIYSAIGFLLLGISSIIDSIFYLKSYGSPSDITSWIVSTNLVPFIIEIIIYGLIILYFSKKKVKEAFKK
jgi:hypothetical protein